MMTGHIDQSTDHPRLRYLAHYTSLSAFHSIVANNEMWASHVGFMNDRRELTSMLNSIVETALEAASEQKSPIWRRAITRAVERMQGGDLPDTFVVSCTPALDSLPHWRGYGGEGPSVCVVFDRAKIAALAIAKGGHLTDVVYGNLGRARVEVEAIKPALHAEISLYELLGLDEDEDAEDIVFTLICRLLPRHKANAFHSEDEYRLVFQSPTAASVRYRASSNSIIPYISLSPEHERLPIEKVFIGPRGDGALIKTGVERFLRAAGYQCVDVRTSSIDIRW